MIDVSWPKVDYQGHQIFSYKVSHLCDILIKPENTAEVDPNRQQHAISWSKPEYINMLYFGQFSDTLAEDMSMLNVGQFSDKRAV